MKMEPTLKQQGVSSPLTVQKHLQSDCSKVSPSLWLYTPSEFGSWGDTIDGRLISASGPAHPKPPSLLKAWKNLICIVFYAYWK